MELVNEVFVLIYTYHLYLYTDFMTDLEVRGIMGKVLVYVSMLNIAVNLGASALETVKSGIWKCKIQYLRMKRKKQLKKEKK